MKRFIGFLLLMGAVSADPLDDAVASYQSLQEGRMTFQVRVGGAGPWQPPSTLVFRRPDRLHYWCEIPEPEGARQVHTWLDQSKLWSWTSRDWNGTKNVYTSDDAAGGLKDVDEMSLGPAIFVVKLLTGQRQSLPLDTKKSTAGELWFNFPAADGEAETSQLVLDPSSHRVKEIVAWKGGKEMARARVEYPADPVKSEELIWTMPADSTLMK